MEVRAKVNYYGNEYFIEKDSPTWNAIPDLSKFVLTVERKKK